MLYFAQKLLIVLLLFASFLMFNVNEVQAAISWEKEPYLCNNNKSVCFHIKKAISDEFYVVLYLDGKAVSAYHCGKGTENCRPPNPLKLPSAYIGGTIGTVKVCSGGPTTDESKRNCESDGRTLLLEKSIDISEGKGNLGQAGTNPCTVTTTGGSCDTALGNIPTDPQGLATKILGVGVGLGGAFAFILMVIGSIRVLTSSGDPKNVAAGRDMIVAAIAGLLFIIFSVLILRFIGIQIIGL